MKNENFHPAVREVMAYFSYASMSGREGEVAAKFQRLASELALGWPQSRETTVALRKLLEGRDAALRAVKAADEPAAPDPAA